MHSKVKQLILQKEIILGELKGLFLKQLISQVEVNIMLV